MEIPFPTESMNPWMWIAGVSILFVVAVAGYAKLQADKLAKQVESRYTRCEGREDRLIADNRACIASQKDALAAAVRATELAETTVELHRQTDSKIEQNRYSMDTIGRILGDIQKALDEMRRNR